jgi:hydroxyacylglutathione hydrolase
MNLSHTWRFTPTAHPLVIPIDAFADNYLWLIKAPDGRAAVAVDPGDANAISQALSKAGLQLVAILLTHHHADHAGGVGELVSTWHCPVYGPVDERLPDVDHPVSDGNRFVIDALETEFSVIAVPGHTRSHIAYRCAGLGSQDERGLLFCGDTLFAAGCGRIFEGTPEQMLDSLDRLAAQPGETLIYCAHEYTIANLRFAMAADPDHAPGLQRLAEATRMRELGLRTVPTSIEIERETNPFLRCGEPGLMRSAGERLGRPPKSRLEAFGAIREWKNHFR